MVITASGRTGARAMRAYARSISAPPPSGMAINGLGSAARERGHKREPLPPHRTAGMNGNVFCHFSHYSRIPLLCKNPLPPRIHPLPGRALESPRFRAGCCAFQRRPDGVGGGGALGALMLWGRAVVLIFATAGRTRNPGKKRWTAWRRRISCGRKIRRCWLSFVRSGISPTAASRTGISATIRARRDFP